MWPASLFKKLVLEPVLEAGSQSSGCARLSRVVVSLREGACNLIRVDDRNLSTIGQRGSMKSGSGSPSSAFGSVIPTLVVPFAYSGGQKNCAQTDQVL